MKWFYIISIGVVLVLSSAPFLLLKADRQGRFNGKMVLYGVYGAKIKSVDPATAGDVASASIQGNIYEGLYTYHYLKRPLEVIPLLAAKLPKISPDGLTYTIPLKRGVKYARNPCFGMDSDGRPATRTVRAEDFVTAFKRIADYHLVTGLSLAFVQDRIVGINDYRERTKSYRKGDFSRYVKEDLAGVRAIDDHTLQIKLVRPFPQMLYVLATLSYAPIPTEAIDYYLASQPDGHGGRKAIAMDKRDPEIRTKEAMVATGPYMLSEWRKANLIILDRNPDFRDDFYPSSGAPGDRAAGLLKDAGKKLPFVDVRYLTFVSEAYPMWELFLTGQIDRGGIPRDVFSSVITPSRKLADKWRARGIRLVTSTSPSVYWLAFNMADPVLGASKSLRQGLCLAFDVETYIRVIYNGRAIRAVNTIPSSFKGHDQAGPSPYARFDLAAAKRKIAAAKDELVAAGVIQPGDEIPTLTLELGSTDEAARRLGEFCQGQFRQVGITLKVEPNDWPTLQQKVANKKAQMFSMGWQADYPDAENFLQLYYTPNINRGTNSSNYSNPTFDKLFRQASVTPNEDRRTAIYAKMIRLLNEDCPVMLLTEPVYFSLLYDWVDNFKPHPIAYGLGKYTRIDTALRRKMGAGH